MWVIAVVALGCLVALAVALLCVPVDASVCLRAPGKPRFRLTIRWLFGTLHKEVTGRKAGKERHREKPAKAGRGRRTRNPLPFIRILATRGLARQIIALVKDIFRCFKIRSLAVDLRIGLEDPAETGMLFGLIAPVFAMLPSSAGREVSVQPDFQEAVFRGSLDGVITLRPIALIPPFFRFALSAPAFRAAWRLMSSRATQRGHR